MKNHIEPVAKLIAKFGALPGVGVKTAQRYAYAVLDLNEDEVADFAAALIEAKKNTRFCTVCGGFSEADECEICSTRDRKIICAVSEPKDIFAMEKIRGFKGVYHVLGGVISPLDGRTPDDLRIKELLNRLNKDNVAEVIMATNPDVEGEATACYLARLLKPFGIKVTRLAQGVQIGTNLEYADEVTLTKAFENRKNLD